ncbi:MAG TPA: glycosyltransferase family 39 protein [Candidatus Limnocylindria bacterium]|nr:glycosyltransferase family 39 protein [Candidatus Limnocylindria bacterium]
MRPTPVVSGNASPGWHRWALAAILLLALALRVVDLGGESVWIDEGFSIRLARMPLPELLPAASHDIHPPLYYFLLHFWVGLFGSSEAAVRSLSVVFGMLGIALVARLGRRWLGAETGLLAAFLLAISPFHVHYSQEARAYAQNLFFTLLSLVAFLSWMEHGGTRRALVYVAATALMVYTHSYGWLAVLAQNLVAVLPRFRPLRPRGPNLAVWFLSQAGLGLLFLPWLAVLRTQVHLVQISFYAGAPTWLTLGGTLIGYAGSPALLALSLLGFGWAALRVGGTGEDSVRPRRVAELLVLWIVLLVFVPFAISNLWFPTYIRRATMGALPAWYLLVAAGVARMRSVRWQAALVAAFTILCAIELASYYREVNKERWREAVRAIEREARAGDLVLFNQWYSKRDAYDYYARRTDLVLLPFPELGQPWGADPEARLERLVADRARVWVVFSHSSDTQGVIVRTLGRRYRLAWHQAYENRSLDRSRYREFVGVDAYRFER